MAKDMPMNAVRRIMKETDKRQFHVVQEANEAVDEVRRTESKRTEDLKNTRYIWLKNEANLTKAQKETLDKLKDCELDTVKAYRMRLILQEM
uniref:transposase n=1 Tax=Paenibacillus durus TaxID=44251 RepID=UPI000472BFE1|nr:transposase [Paenibacillus durus]